MEEKLKELMAEIFDVQVSDINDTFNPDSTNNWDSLNNLKLITAIESEFNVSFSMEEIQTMTDFKAILSCIKNHS